MKINTSELTGAALDWAVAKALDLQGKPLDWVPLPYSTSWQEGGPIIEREGMRLDFHGDTWEAMVWWDDENGRGDIVRYGPTPLIAAMRCFVASKLGDTVDIPRNLCASTA